MFQFQGAPRTIGARLVMVCVACLGCPQLLEDDFALVGVSPQGPDAGSPCAEPSCEGPVAGSGGAELGRGGSDGASGTVGQAGAGGDGGGSGGAGNGELGGAAGMGGAATGGGSAGASGAAGTSAGAGSTGGAASVGPATPGCWQVLLSGDRHSASDNCLDIHGWNAVETDPETPATDVNLSYEDGSVCFSGNVAASGWGAVYNLTFADASSWDAEQRGVSGFSFDIRGPSLPPELEVIYSDTEPGDHCRVVVPSGQFSVRFDSTHPSCTTANPGTSVPDASGLTHLRLHFPTENSPYPLDFCLALRAIE